MFNEISMHNEYYDWKRYYDFIIHPFFLVHPNVKLFICHGGISGVYEAVDAGIPVLGFPLLFDQKKNLENLVDAGMAISMNLKSMSKDVFKKVVLELINNKK